MAIAAISKLADAVRGIARHGPMARYIAIVNALPNAGWILEERFSSPSVLSTAISPMTGSPIAVIANPMKAGTKCSPASMARNGGKMRFPAPKNIENMVSGIRMRLLSIEAI